MKLPEFPQPLVESAERRLRVLAISDFDPKGSGYGTITEGLCSALARRGGHVVVLGIDDKGAEHPFPFTVVPSSPRMVSTQAGLAIREMRPDAVVVALDLTWQTKAIELSLVEPSPGEPPPVYVGVFAVEGGPLLTPSPWASTIQRMGAPFAISQFGAEQCHAAGLGEVQHLRVGIDPFWRPLSFEQRQLARENIGLDDRFVITMVADNQERKNLPAAFESLAKLRGMGVNAFMILLAKQRPMPVSWDLWALARTFGVQKSVFILDHAEREKMRELYSIADAFMVTSKAEGLCLPVLEAMACGTPTVATRTCSLPYMLEGRGLLADVAHEFIDPFGNTVRQYVSTGSVASQLKCLAGDSELRESLREAGLRYVQTLTWDTAAEQVEEAIRQAKEKTRNVKAQQAQVTDPSLPDISPDSIAGGPSQWGGGGDRDPDVQSGGHAEPAPDLAKG